MPATQALIEDESSGATRRPDHDDVPTRLLRIRFDCTEQAHETLTGSHGFGFALGPTFDSGSIRTRPPSAIRGRERLPPPRRARWGCAAELPCTRPQGLPLGPCGPRPNPPPRGTGNRARVLGLDRTGDLRKTGPTRLVRRRLESRRGHEGARRAGRCLGRMEGGWRGNTGDLASRRQESGRGAATFSRPRPELARRGQSRVERRIVEPGLESARRPDRRPTSIDRPALLVDRAESEDGPEASQWTDPQQGHLRGPATWVPERLRRNRLPPGGRGGRIFCGPQTRDWRRGVDSRDPGHPEEVPVLPGRQPGRDDIEEPRSRTSPRRDLRASLVESRNDVRDRVRSSPCQGEDE